MAEGSSRPPLLPGDPPPSPLSPPPPHAEASSSNSVRIDYEELERLRRIERIFERLHIISLRCFVEENRNRMQYLYPLQAGQAVGAVPPKTFMTPCTDFARAHFDSLVLMVVDNLLRGYSYGGCWDLDSVLVSNGKCFLEDRAVEDGTQLEYAFKDLRALGQILVEIFNYLGYGFPPFFPHLLDLLNTPPTHYDTDPEVRCRYLLTIRNSVVFASPSRLYVLLVNFGQLCRSISDLDKEKLEEVARNTMPRIFVPYDESLRFELHYDWKMQAATSELLQRLKEFKKLKSDPEATSTWISEGLYPSLAYLLRICLVHLSEVFTDANGKMILDDFMEIIYLIEHLMEDALPNLVEFVLECVSVHNLVRSMWNIFNRR